MDPTRGLSAVAFLGVSATALTAPDDLIKRLPTAAMVAVSAEQVGAAEAALELQRDRTRSPSVLDCA